MLSWLIASPDVDYDLFKLRPGEKSLSFSELACFAKDKLLISESMEIYFERLND